MRRNRWRIQRLATVSAVLVLIAAPAAEAFGPFSRDHRRLSNRGFDDGVGFSWGAAP